MGGPRVALATWIGMMPGTVQMGQQNRRRMARHAQHRRDGLSIRTSEKPRLAAVLPVGEAVKAPLISRSVVQGVAAFGESLPLSVPGLP
jgi:hypothetical protein